MSRKSELQKIKDKIAQLETEKQNLEQLLKESPDTVLADVIHGCQCHWNHTDGCGYFYNTWDNPGYERLDYLKKAQGLLEYLHQFSHNCTHGENEKPIEEVAEEIIHILHYKK